MGRSRMPIAWMRRVNTLPRRHLDIQCRQRHRYAQRFERPRRQGNDETTDLAASHLPGRRASPRLSRQALSRSHKRQAGTVPRRRYRKIELPLMCCSPCAPEMESLLSAFLRGRLALRSQDRTRGSSSHSGWRLYTLETQSINGWTREFGKLLRLLKDFTSRGRL